MLARAEWTWPLEIVIPIALLAVWLAAGLALEFRGTTFSHGGGWKRSLYSAAAILSLIFALDSPIHELGEKLFWVHMTQHEILMLICAPLLVAAVSLRFLLSPLKLLGVDPVIVAHWRPLRFVGHTLSRPTIAWVLQLAALFIWHIPHLFDATLANDYVHAAQHISFLGTAVLFWWSLELLRNSHGDSGAAILYVFSTAIYTSFLGVLLTFSNHPWYTAYGDAAQAFGLTPIEDQQLGGLIMWIPAGVVLTTLALAMVPGFLRSADRRARQWKLSDDPARGLNA